MSSNNTGTTTSAVYTAADVTSVMEKITDKNLITWSFEFDVPGREWSQITDNTITNGLAVKPENAEFLKQYKDTISKNTITDTDLVFFEQSSNYPRNNFNKYSGGAKRIQNKSKANKYVVGDFNIPSTTFGYGDLMRTSNGMFNYINVNKIVREIHSNIHYTNNTYLYSSFLKSAGFSTVEISEIEDKLDSRYYSDFKGVIAKYGDRLAQTCPGYSTDIWSHCNTRYWTVKEKQAIENLFNQDSWSALLTDKAVNQYIDEGKQTLTLEQMNNIMPLLKGDEANVGIGLKILENMNLQSNRAEFVAMMTLCFIENERRIKKSPTWNYTAVKNMRKDYNLDRLNYISEADGISKIGKIGELYKTVPTDKQEAFKKLTRDTIIKLVEYQTGVSLKDLL